MAEILGFAVRSFLAGVFGAFGASVGILMSFGFAILLTKIFKR